MEGFVGHQREGEGFFGVFGNAELRRGYDLNWGQCRGELGDDQRVASAATGDDELVDFVFGKNEAMQRVDY